jgi:hypothetical protein
MVMAMMAGPPQGPPLGAGSAEHCKGKLHGSGRFECSMRKIPMIPTGNREHPNEVKRDGNRHSGPTGAYPDDTQAHHMDGDDGDAAKPVHLGDAIGFHILKAGPGVEPS